MMGAYRNVRALPRAPTILNTTRLVLFCLPFPHITQVPAVGMSDDTFNYSLAASSTSRETSSTAHTPPTPPFWEAERPWTTKDPLRFPMPGENRDLKYCRRLVEEHDDGRCAAWKDEIQNLLLFAGLFSAIVTAFSVEATRLLQGSPEDVTVQLLGRITTQLEFSHNEPSSTLPRLPSFAPPPNAIRVNILWAISLTISLAVVTVGIVCLQWLREYQRQDPGRSDKDALAARDLRAESIKRWKIPFIISILPILLQAALALFLCGLVDYFFAMSPFAAWVISAFVGPTLLFIIITPMLPGLHDFILTQIWPGLSGTYCAYRSPQAWAFTMLCSAVAATWHHLRHLTNVNSGAAEDIPLKSCIREIKHLQDWIAYDGWRRKGPRFRHGFVFALCRLLRLHRGTDSPVLYAAYHSLRDIVSVDEAEDASREIFRTADFNIRDQIPESLPPADQVNFARDLLMFHIGRKVFRRAEPSRTYYGE
ncbi:hypothetical protein CC2G_014109 [Coprinopsis cinerea AmutBmut pab1-1]|nr:hypothetical protein CC2G_014109 [Coprinopsis cinerea AmutBmut pab1-1]